MTGIRLNAISDGRLATGNIECGLRTPCALSVCSAHAIQHPQAADETLDNKEACGRG